MAAVILKLASYGFLRVLIPFFPEATYYFLPLVQTIAAITIVYASLSTLRQIDTKQLVAMSSVAPLNGPFNSYYIIKQTICREPKINFSYYLSTKKFYNQSAVDVLLAPLLAADKLFKITVITLNKLLGNPQIIKVFLNKILYVTKQRLDQTLQLKNLFFILLKISETICLLFAKINYLSGLR